MKPASPCWMRIPANPAAFAPCPPTRHTRASRWTAIPSISPTARRFTAPRRCCPTCWTISRMMRNWRFCRITRRFSRIRHTQSQRRRFWTTKRFTRSTAPPCPPWSRSRRRIYWRTRAQRSIRFRRTYTARRKSQRIMRPESRASAGIVVLGQRRPACIHPAAASSGRRMHRGDVRAGIDPHRADDDA